MKRGAQVALGLSVLFFRFFLFGTTDLGQALLRGQIAQMRGIWKLDDIYMGSGLAPWI